MNTVVLGIMLVGSTFLLSGCTNEAAYKVPEKDVKLSIGNEKIPEKAKNESTKKESTGNVQGVNNEKKTMNTAKQYPAYPEMSIDTEKKYTAILKTSAGEMVIRLNAKETPKTVNNFIFLAREKFYDGVIFHRTIPGFMIQGGDPTGTGMGNPGYRFEDEPFTGEYKRGTIAMANSGKNTNGSQFFIMHADYPLPKNYVIFGEVTSGIETVDKIATAPTQPGGEGSRPVDPVTIESVTIVEE